MNIGEWFASLNPGQIIGGILFLTGCSLMGFAERAFTAMTAEVNAKIEGEKFGYYWHNFVKDTRIENLHRQLYPESKLRRQCDWFTGSGLIIGVISFFVLLLANYDWR